MGKQDDLINFIDDPNTINKVVEGSMDKRLRALSNAELREAIKRLDGVPRGGDPNDIVLLTTDRKILALFQAREQQLLSEARLSERAWAYKNMRDHGTDPQWIEIARLRMERLINAGKLDNSNPPIQKLDKSVQNKTNDGGRE